MRKIRYNIASEKKIRHRRVILISSILVILSLGCVAAGIWRLSAENRLHQDEIEELKILRGKFSDVREMIADYRSRIEQIKKKWGPKINFSNGLIDRKSFSMTEKLDLLEDLIPEGVFLNHLRLVNEPKAEIQLGCVSDSFKNLLVFYKNLSGYGMTIKRESVLKDGLYRADLMIKIADEKD